MSWRSVVTATLPDPTLVPPAFHTGPSFEFSRGDEVADFSASLGFVMDPEQRLVLVSQYGATGPGANYRTMSPRWAAMESAVIAPRQNLKTGLLKPSALADCLLFGAKSVIWSAQRRKTSMSAFRDLEQMIESHSWLSREVRQIHRSTGSEAIAFTNGALIQFVVRSEAGVRGETIDKVIVDEALFFTADQRQSLQPAQAAVPNPMIVYASSPGLKESLELRAIRDRGRTGDATMSYDEWASTKPCDDPKCLHSLESVGCVADDEDEWQVANPALHRRISIEFLRSARRAMAGNPEKFLIEHMGHWPEGGMVSVIPAPRWAACASDGVIIGPVTLFVDMHLDRSRSTIAVCGADIQGIPQVELVRFDDAGTANVAEKVEQMLADHDVLAGGARSAGPVASLLPELREVFEAASVDFATVGSGEIAAMCGGFYDAVMTGTLRHRGDTRITDALKASKKHKVVDGWSWERVNVDVDSSPLVAITGAHALFARSLGTQYDVLSSVY